MRAKNYLVLAFLGTSLLASRAASAQEEETTGIGVGVESFLTSELYSPGPNWVAVSYDASLWRVSGMLTMSTYEDTVTYMGIAGRFWYPVHSRHDSDFSVGGGVAILNTNPDGGGESDTSIELELGVQLRAFLTRNVALSTSLGIGIYMADNDGPLPDESAFGLLGQLVGSFGVTYYFW